jgi:hypothetical protein
MMPLTSILATVIAVFMMFGRSSIRIVMRLFRMRLGRTGRARTLPTPHFTRAAGRKATKVETKQ